jgi:PIN domain nuclease of toxin-antitoxin system
MTVLLDTHALIWYASDSPKLSTSAKDQIIAAESVFVCAISAWEIGMLVEKERLALSIDVEEWIKLAYQLTKVKWISLTPEIAVLAARLPGEFHGDPADRLICATALAKNVILITADKKIQSYLHVKTVW